ncbi:hypothetical protein D5S18_33235 [Nocardia panacis]|uniref:Uncharacterized protein n=1 Tax=Nocardia panacis TaxID=2340916 RepID=A0A3A4K8P6_9NOCA|nr:hypothetical protein [Nocardia panacis]RJO68288.1 hypothetical protein D5S18_33235 [Nocardia panacis]
MYSRCCTFHTGRANVRPDIPAVLDLVAAGRFDPAPVTETTVGWDDTVEALLGTRTSSSPSVDTPSVTERRDRFVISGRGVTRIAPAATCDSREESGNPY